MYAFDVVLALLALSHAFTFKFVVLYNVVLLRVADVQFGSVPPVVYFIVPSLAVHDTAIDDPKV